MEFGHFWQQTTSTCPEGMVSVFVEDGQEGGSVKFMTPADAEAWEAEVAAEQAAENAAWEAEWEASCVADEWQEEEYDDE
jgi:hypothetical protein